jgi:hypothetical protein
MRAYLASLLLLVAAVPARADEPAPKPASTPTAASTDDPPEPPPAPLIVEEPAPPPLAPAPSPKPIELATRPPDRPYRIAAWVGVGLTLGFVVTGTVLGVLAQRNSDALQRETTQLVDGRPAVYDAAVQARYTDLMDHGVAWNRAAIACLIVAGATAVTSGLLFWDATRRAEKKDKLALRPAVSTGPGTAQLLLSGRF